MAERLGADYFTNLPVYKGVFTTDADGNVVHTSSDGITNYASQAGLSNETIMRMLQMAEATGDLELANVLSEQLKLPSSTNADIAKNEYTTAQADMGTSLTPYQQAALQSDYGLTQAKNNMDIRTMPSLENATISGNTLTTAQNAAGLQLLPSSVEKQISGNYLDIGRNNILSSLVNEEGAAIKSGYDATTAGNTLSAADSTMQTGLVGDKGQALRTGYNLNTAQNESAMRTMPFQEGATNASLLYQKAQSEAGTRLTPLQESQTASDLKYKTSMSDGQASLLPQRFAATGKFIDESMNGKSVTGAMNEASADVGMAYKGAKDANRRNMSRMGIMPSANSAGDDSLNMAKLNVGARANARRTTEEDNYRKLGAVALMP